MRLFGKKEKKSCSCGGNCPAEVTETVGNQAPQAQDTVVKILGSGCAKCNQLESNTREALKQLGLVSTVDHVTDFAQIAAFGVMTTPALVYNEKVLVYGKVPKPKEIMTLIQKEG